MKKSDHHNTSPVQWQHPKNGHAPPHPRPQRRRSDGDSGNCCGRMICKARLVALLAVVIN